MAILQPSPFFDTLERGIRQGAIPGKEKAARQWYRDEAKKILVPQDVNAILQPEATFRRRDVRPGFMYMYQYDPLWKEKLPYWDMFPLVFPFEVEADRFHGINLHYLDRRMRARLMDRLHANTIYPNYTDRQKLVSDDKQAAFSYNVLKGVVKFKWFEPCVKTYLFKHLRSPLYKIPSQMWDIALFLPTERFQKASKTKVWKDSAEQIRNKWGKQR